ncbi:2-hydroxyacid dehydrogenase [Swaminathania salitolerans]|uniref:Glyoxylate/hydroxypyruvate reductase A n=1 Tax=Swaminathania salitolerans TaxID=182838 RepID=A0A511BWV5_9PROT|nr:glyoxylate/hydroxypyruvate reductase A [Swaminathania salitolerans]GBQ11454.1 D-isomer specific 2-hydroxyacid dehydrogenase [Swaminathania salitolerans LMG 21291]GEL02488.1 glyoxylate/hydroxypyruvate reductase A [Swaminathania salitolerans]
MTPRLTISADGPEAFEGWRQAFAACAPDIETVSWFDPATQREAAHYALVWEVSDADLGALSRMRGILCTGAGVNHLVSRPGFPDHVPLIRMGGDDTGILMADYVLWAAISLLRDARGWALQQAARVWSRNLVSRTSRETEVTVLGYGQIGSVVAQHLAKAGFSVTAWRRSGEGGKDGPVHLCTGDAALSARLEKTDLLVNLLPSTSRTRHILDRALLGRMKPGAGLINVGRGDHLVEADLIALLDEGRLGGAVLDVTAEEPLPANAPLWEHPRIILTPHVASEASRRAQVLYLADVIRQLERGERPALLFDRERGY